MKAVFRASFGAVLCGLLLFVSYTVPSGLPVAILALFLFGLIVVKTPDFRVRFFFRDRLPPCLYCPSVPFLGKIVTERRYRAYLSLVDFDYRLYCSIYSYTIISAPGIL